MENYVWLIFVALGVLALNQLASIARSMRVSAEMMKRLLAHQGIEWETQVEPSERVKALAKTAKTRIAAIKAYREQTGLGLKEAKAVIDGLRARHETATRAASLSD